MIPRRVRLATLLAFALHGVLVLTAQYQFSFDAYTHMWLKNRRPFLNVTQDEYEGHRYAPPENINSALTHTQYKTVRIVNQRYAAERQGVLDYLSHNAGDI